jgi:glutaminyl-peptide cyclotransferase
VLTRAGLLCLVCIVSGLACTGEAPANDAYTVVTRLPHDTSAYTQGLFVRGGEFVESTGKYGQSDIRRVDMKTGRILQRVRLADDRFGEGAAAIGDKVYQLTWESNVGYVYDARSLARVDSFSFQGEGWGLASDGVRLFMTDGTATIRVIDPRTFRVTDSLEVRYRDEPLTRLNELEYISGELFANVYQTDWIARIDPRSGTVREVVDFSDLYRTNDASRRNENVLNGIAYDSSSGNLYVTGKRWPFVFEIKLKRPPGTEGAQAR